MLNIYCGKTLFDGYKHLMKRLEENRKSKLFSSHIFVVPDRFSMACEKDIFEYLNIESTFDIKVLTMSRFASQLIGAATSVISKSVSTMIVQKILLDNKKDLKCFFKTRLTSGFASELFETINQLKSCNIKPEEIVINGEDFLAQKLADIKYVFTKYEEYLKTNGLIDSADKFELFEARLPTYEKLKDCCIYISHFDSFTKQGYAIVKRFLEKAKQVNISVAKSDGGINGHIYLNDVFDNIMSIAAGLNIEPNIFECEGTLTDNFEHIKNNLFAYNPKEKELRNHNITISCHSSYLQECEYVATAIKSIINSGARYRDIAVAMPGLEQNKDTIKRVFDEFGINYFIDCSTTLTTTIIDKFIENIVSLKTRFFKKEDIIKFIKNPIINLDKDFVYKLENYILIKNIDGKTLFCDAEILNEFRESAKVYFDFFTALLQKGNYSYYSDSFLQLFEDIMLENRLLDMSKNYFEKGFVEESKKTEQIYAKTKTLLEGLKEIFGQTECDIYEFLDVIKSGFDATNISVTPVSVDSVFVGDSSKSIFERAKHLFVLGAKEGDFPVVNSDCGLITDREIDKLSSQYKIEPSIKTINERERFKAFNLVLTPTESLHISYSMGMDKRTVPASIVSDLQKMFFITTPDGKQKLDFLDNDYNYFDFCEKLGGRYHAEKIMAEFLRNIEDGVEYENLDEIAALLNVVKQNNRYFENYKEITNYKNINNIKTNLFFKKGTLSVSEIERYYACPFKHFIDYGLKLKQNRVESFDVMQVGNYLHKVAEIFVKDNLKSLPIKQEILPQIVVDICDKVLDSDEFCFLKDSDENILSIISIKKEAVRMCRAINYQIQKSDFKPVLTEARFDNKGLIKSIDITVEDKVLRIVGAIDRVDMFDDYFRIIDYKTGRCDSSLKELFFGKKLQLYVYQYVTAKSTNLKPAGVYYFPVKNAFTEEDKGYFAYRLKGYTNYTEKVLDASDNQLKDKNASDIICVTKKKDGGFSAYSEVMAEEDILALAEYAMKSLTLATSEILQGNIKPSPLGPSEREACKYCEYKAICRFDENFGNRVRSTNEKIELESIKGGLDGRD